MATLAEERPSGGANPLWTERRMVVILTFIAMLALLDKYALSLLVQPIKSDLGLSDAQVGLAVGAAFAVANIAAGLPAGWAADRLDRRALIFFGVLFWSLMAALCGLATSFFLFFLARAGVGFGEGLIPPASYSLIRDGVATERQGRAFGLFAMSNTAGPGLALLLGGALLGAVVSLGWGGLPVLGELAPWRMTLIILGMAGIPLAFLAFAFPPPSRKAASGSAGGYGEVIAMMRREGRIFGPLLAFSCACAMIGNSLGIWLPAYIGRNWGLAPQEVGAILGLILLISGPAGMLALGQVVDRMHANGREAAGRAAIAVSLLLMLCATSVTLVPSLTLMWVIEVGVVSCSTCYLAIVSVVVSRRAPAHLVGRTMALMLVVQGIFGAGFAPVLVGFLTDHLLADAGGLGTALALNAAVLTAVALVAAVALHRALEKSGKEGSA